MKIVKIVLGGIGALLLLAVIGVVTKFYVLSPKSRPAQNVTAPTSAEAIARGKYLANHVTVCVGCHSPVQDDKPGEPLVEDKVGSGRDFGEMPGFPGRVRPHNLTPDMETGIGAWTDGEILR